MRRIVINWSQVIEIMTDAFIVRKIMETDVLTSEPDVSAYDAACLMVEKGTGSLVVMDGTSPIGIFTERDLMHKCITENIDPHEISISEIMTKEIVAIHPDKTLDDAHQVMLRGDFRHLLVVENGSLLGIFSIKDLVRVREQVLEQRVNEKTREIRKVQRQLTESLDVLNRELAAASRFQKDLVNKKYPPTKKKIKFSHIYEQASSVGGDFFELQKIDNNHLAIFMADVMGHGVTSAMIAVELKMHFDQVYPLHLHPAPVITKLNRRLIPLMPAGYFVAGLYGIVNLETLCMEYTQFGLPRPLVLKSGTSKVVGMPHGNIPLGISENTRYISRKVNLSPGDSILLFTDGCIEQRNPAGKIFGDRQFVKTFKEYINDGKGKVVRRLYKKVIDYSQGEQIGDDIAILLCEIL